MNQDEKRTKIYLIYEKVKFKNTAGTYDFYWDNTNKENDEMCLYKIGRTFDINERVRKALLDKWKYNVERVICAVDCASSKITLALEKMILNSVDIVDRNSISNETITLNGNVLGNQDIKGVTRNGATEWFVVYSKEELYNIINKVKLAGTLLNEWNDYIVGD